MAYTYKMVNGVKTTLTSGDQTALANKDAAGWTAGQAPAAAADTPAKKLARLAQAFNLTVADLKSEILRP